MPIQKSTVAACLLNFTWRSSFGWSSIPVLYIALAFTVLHGWPQADGETVITPEGLWR